jgi:hypothetical protein
LRTSIIEVKVETTTERVFSDLCFALWRSIEEVARASHGR